MALPEPYTIPEMELTPEDDVQVKVTMMTGRVGAYILMPRNAARWLLYQLALGTPEWLRDD